MSFSATMTRGLTTYAASLWVQNMQKLLPFDAENVWHMLLYALLLTLAVYTLTQMLDDDDESF